MSATAPVSRAEPLFIADDFSLPLSAFAIPPHYSAYLSHVLLPHGLIQDRVDKLVSDAAAAAAAASRCCVAACRRAVPLPLAARATCSPRARARARLVEPQAADIGAVYGSSTPHILVVLKGGNEFAGDLARALRLRPALAGGA